MKLLHVSAGASAAVLAAALVMAPPAALAQTGVAGHTRVSPKDSAAGRVVRTLHQGEFSFVRVERAEPGAAASQHPVSVTPEVLRAALASVRHVKADGEPLFNDDELAEIVPALVRGLGALRPDEDLSFAVAGRHGGLGFMTPRSVTTGRLFATAEGLQLIVGLARLPFESQYLATGYVPAFEPGRRAAGVDKNVAIRPASGTARRADWVSLVLAPAAAAAPTAGVVPAAAAPAAAAVVPPATPARPRDPAFFEEQENRLRALKRLRDANLITEDEYQMKRREILATL